MIGPSQDFTLYHVLRRGICRQIAFLATHAWSDATAGVAAELPDAKRTAYDLATIRHWMTVFGKRFHANQFKRSALPNSPKVVRGGSLSPRGDWRMPSDVSRAPGERLGQTSRARSAYLRRMCAHGLWSAKRRPFIC